MKTFSRILLKVTLFLFFFEMFLRLGGLIFVAGQNLMNQAPSSSINENKKEIVILSMGDSMTAFGRINSYPKILERLLNKTDPTRHYSVINKGIPARPSLNVVSYLPTGLEEFHPDIVTVMMGIEDYSFRRRINSTLPEKIKVTLLQNVNTFRLMKRLIDPLRPDLKKRLVIDDSNLGLWTDIKKPIETTTKLGDSVILPQEKDPNPKGLKLDLYADQRWKALTDISPITINSFKDFVEIATSKGIPVIIVQYPLVDIKPLKEKVGERKNVYFVENKNNFEKALSTSKKEEYFEELLTPHFGHCTPQGNYLIAEKIADAIHNILK